LFAVQNACNKKTYMSNQQSRSYGTLFAGKSYTFVMLAALFLLERAARIVPS